MGLVKTTEILREASDRGYAVGAFDVVNLEFLEGVLAGAESRRAPVILSLAQNHLDYVDMETFAGSLLRAADRASVPVSVHLDHGKDLDTVVRAIRYGFTSVMIDGSTLSYEENVYLTRQVVRIAHAAGVSVEAELGFVAGREFYSHGKDATGSNVEATATVYTDPDLAADFVEKTKVDFLAVSVGTVHGLFTGRLRLDIPRLKEIRKKVSVPLVLHGGSGLTDEEFSLLIAGGISKVNFYSELSHAAIEAIKKALATDPGVTEITCALSGMKDAVRRIVEEKIDVWGCCGIK